MKIKSDNNKSKVIIISAAIIFALLLITAGIAYKIHSDNSKQATESAERANEEKQKKAEQTKSDLSIKEQSVESDKNATKPNSQQEQQTSPDSSNVAVTITSPSNQDINNFRIRGYIDYATADGTCTLTLTSPSSKTITKSTQGLQPNNQISGCPDITIGSNELSKGTWQATLSYQSSSHSGTTTQEVIIN